MKCLKMYRQRKGCWRLMKLTAPSLADLYVPSGIILAAFYFDQPPPFTMFA